MHAIAEPCPSCGGFTIRRSHWRREDFALLLRLFRPLRCRSCGDRFYAPIFGNRTVDPGDSDREFVVRIRLRRGSLLTRALLSFLGDAAEKTRIQ